VQERKNGLLYEGSYWYQHQPKELSVGEYLDARIVSTPLSINDCDLPIQGVGAFVLTTGERAKDLRHPPAYVCGIGESEVPLSGIPIVTLDVQLANAKSIGASLWADSGLALGDVKVADLYDGFSMLTISWLEGLGFCGEGEGFEFIQEGRIAIDGELPVNPSGGSIGSGRLHGCNHLMDGILQVMGRSGRRQVSNAEVALVAIGPPHPTSPALLLSRHPV
jgi:acetyl-CoA acetyltransferase